jgi:hypothetical protein
VFVKKIIFFTMILIFFTASGAGAEVFHVTTTSDSDCSDNVCGFQEALTAATTNNQNDEIVLAAGTYSVTNRLVYHPGSDSGSLTIEGAGADTTILNGNGATQILHVDTTGMGDDANAHIIISGITCLNGVDLNTDNTEDTGGVYIATTSADITIRDSLFIDSYFISSNSGTVSIISNSDVIIPDGSQIHAGSATLTTVTGRIDVGGSLNIDGDLSFNSGQDVSLVNHGVNGVTVGIGSVVSIDGGAVDLGVDISATGGTITLAPGNIGVNIGVLEGNTITLDGENLFDNSAATAYGWIQLSGPQVVLSNNNIANPTFVTPPVDENGCVIMSFQSSVEYDSGSQDTKVVSMTVDDNGIRGFSESDITFTSATDRNLGISLGSSGSLTRLKAVDPDTVSDAVDKPVNLIYGLVDIEIKVDIPGDTATVTLSLPEPAPSGYTWFKYNDSSGWYDFRKHISFNDQRDQVTLTLVDGGPGDDDGVANGVIKDPSGLGISAPGGGDACFIATAAHGSMFAPEVSILREFRDRFLLTNMPGKIFVKLYYKHAPVGADFIARHDTLKALVRSGLLPVVCLSWVAMNAGLPGGIFFAGTILILAKRRRRRP